MERAATKVECELDTNDVVGATHDSGTEVGRTHLARCFHDMQVTKKSRARFLPSKDDTWKRAPSKRRPCITPFIPLRATLSVETATTEVASGA